jgi:hypothetical protein
MSGIFTAFSSSGQRVALTLAGTWNATSNTPTLVSSTGSIGTMYQVAVAGSSTLDGISAWLVDDYVYFDGSVWLKDDHKTAVAGTAAVTQTNAVYISKAGNDSSSGLTKDDPKLTIGAAVTVASGLTPTTSNRVELHIQDAGDYAEDVNLPNFVSLIGPAATITGTSTAVDMGDSSVVRLNRIVATGIGITFSNSSDEGWADVDEITTAGVNPAINIQSGILYLKARRIIASSSGNAVNVFGVGHIVLDLGEIEVATGTGFRLGGSVTTAVGTISKITDTGAGIGIDIDASSTGKADLVVGLLDCTTTYTVDTNNTLSLLVSDLIGSVGTISGTANVTEAGAGGSGDITEITGTSYSILVTDDTVLVNQASAAVVTLTLPTGASHNTKRVQIKDKKGTASSFNITVNRSGGDTIDGATSLLLDADRVGVELVFNGTEWSIF